MLTKCYVQVITNKKEAKSLLFISVSPLSPLLVTHLSSPTEMKQEIDPCGITPEASLNFMKQAEIFVDPISTEAKACGDHYYHMKNRLAHEKYFKLPGLNVYHTGNCNHAKHQRMEQIDYDRIVKDDLRLCQLCSGFCAHFQSARILPEISDIPNSNANNISSKSSLTAEATLRQLSIQIEEILKRQSSSSSASTSLSQPEQQQLQSHQSQQQPLPQQISPSKPTLQQVGNVAKSATTVKLFEGESNVRVKQQQHEDSNSSSSSSETFVYTPKKAKIEVDVSPIPTMNLLPASKPSTSSSSSSSATKSTGRRGAGKLELGDEVIVAARKNAQSKLLWTGPGKLVGMINPMVFKVEMLDGQKPGLQIVHASRLMPFDQDKLRTHANIYRRTKSYRMFDIDKILDMKKMNGGKYNCKVHWLGFESYDDTWEPLKSLNKDAPEAVAEFFATKKVSETVKKEALRSLKMKD